MENTYDLVVTQRRYVARDVLELTLGSPDGRRLPEAELGAHVDLRLGDALVRQYSLVHGFDQAAGTWVVSILIERAGRGGSLLIEQALHPGTHVKVSGPRNHFPFVTGRSYLFIAGGIGITPLIGMCRAAHAAGADFKLMYAGRERATMAYLAELQAEFGRRVDVFAISEGRLIDVAKTIADLDADTLVYCCGPEPLINAVSDAMTTPAREQYVHFERFRPATDESFSPNHEFEVFAAKSNVEFLVPDDESILMAADFAGVVVPGDCIEGTCGTCETKVLEGDVEHRDSVLRPSQRLTADSMMICVSRAAPGCSRLVLDL